MIYVISVIIVGGGIGGVVIVLLLVCQGIKVMLLEKVYEIGEIGVGIQFGLNVFLVLDSFGVGDVVCQCVVFIDYIIMMDVVNVEEVVCIEIGQVFCDYFGGLYVVIYWVDIYVMVWGVVLMYSGVEYCILIYIVDICQMLDDVMVFDEQGNSWMVDIFVGCDGVKLVVW